MPAYAGMTFYWCRTYETDSSTARRESVSCLQHRMVHHHNRFPRATLARQLAVRSTGAQL